MSAIEQVERDLLRLLTGEHSSLSLCFNDSASAGYQTVAEYLDSIPAEHELMSDWVSDAECKLARENNSMWVLEWYPRGQVSCYVVAASSLSAIFEYLEREHFDAVSGARESER